MAKVLKAGDNGSEVKKLQSALNDAGAKPKLKTDGKFGPGTVEAVKAFQKQNKLKPDGTAGKDTLDALKNDAEPKDDEKLERLKSILDKLRTVRGESEKTFDKMLKELDHDYKKVTKTGELLDNAAIILTSFAGAAVQGAKILKGAAAVKKQTMKAAVKGGAKVAALDIAVGIAEPSWWAKQVVKMSMGEDHETAYENARGFLIKTKDQTLDKLDLKIYDYERLVKEAGGK